MDPPSPPAAPPRDVSTQEEVVERSRRPTKVCIEYHLHQCGSKSRTFVLPPVAPRGRPRPTSTGEARVEEQPPPPVALEEDIVEKQTGLPPAASLVELVLAPFKSYRQTMNGTISGGDGEMCEAGGEKKNRGKTPPVVKLNVSFLGFVSLGRFAAPVSVPPGQRTLRGMAWLGRDTPSASVSVGRQDGNSNEAGRSSGKVSVGGQEGNSDELSRSSGDQFLDEAAASSVAAAAAGKAKAAPVMGSPIGQHVPISLTVSSASDRRIGGGALVDGTPAPRKGGMSDPPQAVEGSVLVRCPRCRACFPLGDTWDAHREEHLLVLSQEQGLQRWSENVPPTEVPPPGDKPPALEGVFLSPQSSAESPPREPSDAMVTRLQAPGGGVRKEGVGGARRTRSSFAVGRRRGGDGGGRGQGTRLSDLLLQAVSPAQAADVLKERGLLRSDGQTRFARLRLAEGQQQRALDE